MTESNDVRRLAVYGTLAPGKPNHHHLADLSGTWIDGAVRGRLTQLGWGAAMGYPALTLDDAGEIVSVKIFESDELPSAWKRLDDFEGEEYSRVLTAIQVGGSFVLAHIYVLRPEESDLPS